MKTVNMHEAKTHLSRLVEEAAAGEDIVIARAGKPLVRLVAFSAPAGPRKLGLLAGQVVESSDAWTRDPKLDSLFYSGSIEPAKKKRVAEPIPKRQAKKTRGKQ
jgi:prevent-host-death family protein